MQCCGPLARSLSKSECLSSIVPVVQRFAQVSLTATVAQCLCTHSRNSHAYCCAWDCERTSPGAYGTMWRSNCTCSVLRWARRLPGESIWPDHVVLGDYYDHQSPSFASACCRKRVIFSLSNQGAAIDAVSLPSGVSAGAKECCHALTGMR